MLFRGSRYEHSATSEIVDANGRTICYVRMRFIPEATGVAGEVVRQGDRPDLVSYRVFGDAEQFWRLCDVNRIQRPAELAATPGQRIGAPGPGS